MRARYDSGMRGLLVVAGLLASAWSIFGCTCEEPRLKDAKKRAEIVFRGTITEIRDGWIHFRIERVWKGNLPREFLMVDFRETTACVGFWPDHVRAGNDLVVFAYWMPESDPKGAYFTDICSRTGLASKRADDIRRLGRGRKPRNN